MNLLQIQNRINELMARWVASLKGAASMSRTDLNLVSETILVPLLREVYDLPDLRNLNTESANFPGIDLADDNARVAIQVTSTANSTKVKHTLSEFVEHKLFKKYEHLIVYILVEKQRTYSGKGFGDIIGERFTFDKKQDIRDYRDLLGVIQDFQIDRAQRILDILEANFGGDTQPHTPPTATALVLPLPADLPDFTGRQAQIDRVRAQLNQQGNVTITGIHGMGGIGKTALAVHVAHQLVKEGRFPDAQLYIDLKGAGTSPVDPVDALDSLLNAILDPDPNRPRDTATLAALWRQAIEGMDALLILDNAADAVQVRALLPGCPTCAVLITSRQRFNLPGARRLDLRPMQPGEARNLLQELAPHLDDDGADQIAGLCGRLPQALRVAGNYLSLNDDVTPDGYAGMLAGERTRLAQLRDPDDPDLDVYATISLSFAQLHADLRRAWSLLSLFPAPFDLTAAAALWDERDQDQVRTRLQVLRNRSLVTYDPDAARYHQHDLVRLAAAGELEAMTEQEADAAYLRLARHFEQVAREARELYTQGGDNVLQALALFDLEWPHIQAGQAWASAHAEDDDEAAHLCSDYPNAAGPLFLLRLHTGDQIAWIETALQAARRLGDRQGEGAHLGNLAVAYADKGEWDRAIEYHGQTLEMLEQAGDIHGMATVCNNLGVVYRRKGEWDRAIDYYQQALEIHEQVGDIHEIAAAYGNLGVVYWETEEWDLAIEFLEQALEISIQVGDIRGMALTYNNLGLVCADREEWDRAIDYYQQALETLERVGDIHGMARPYNNLGIVYRKKGEPDRAIDYYQQALKICQKIGDRPGEAEICWYLGLLYEEDNPARAVELMSVRVAFEQEVGHSGAKTRARRVEEIRDRL